MSRHPLWGVAELNHSLGILILGSNVEGQVPLSGWRAAGSVERLEKAAPKEGGLAQQLLGFLWLPLCTPQLERTESHPLQGQCGTRSGAGRRAETCLWAAEAAWPPGAVGVERQPCLVLRQRHRRCQNLWRQPFSHSNLLTRAEMSRGSPPALRSTFSKGWGWQGRGQCPAAMADKRGLYPRLHVNGAPDAHTGGTRGLRLRGRGALASALPSSGAKVLVWGEGKPKPKGSEARSRRSGLLLQQLGSDPTPGGRWWPINKPRASPASHPAQGLAPYPSHTPRW